MPSPVPRTMRRSFLTMEGYKRNALMSTFEAELVETNVKPCLEYHDDWQHGSSSTLPTIAESEAGESINKRVRFAQDRSGKVMCHRIYNLKPLAENDIEAAWYTQDEYEALRSNARQESISSFKTEYQSHYMRLYHACGESSASIQSDNVQLLKDGAKSAIAVAQSEFRGYERGLYHGNMRRLRKESVSNVLDAQDEFWENSDLTNDDLGNYLATVSRKLTKRSRRIAFLVGFGDSMAAETVYADR